MDWTFAFRRIRCVGLLIALCILSNVMLYGGHDVVLHLQSTTPYHKNKPVQQMLSKASKRSAQDMCTFIMAYNRPKNVMILLTHLLSSLSDLMNEIVVGFGHKDYYIDIANISKIKNVRHTNIKFVKDWADNDKLFTLKRFITSVEYCASDNILILDDDIVPSREDITRLQTAYNNDKLQMYGFSERWCSKVGYFYGREQAIKSSKYLYTLVLTNYVLMNRYIVRQVSNEMFHNNVFKPFTNQVIEYKGNGEDILFSWIFIHLFGKYPVVLPRHKIPQYIQNLSRSINDTGFHTQSGHYEKRSLFCKQLINQTLDSDSVKPVDVKGSEDRPTLVHTKDVHRKQYTQKTQWHVNHKGKPPTIITSDLSQNGTDEHVYTHVAYTYLNDAQRIEYYMGKWYNLGVEYTNTTWSTFKEQHILPEYIAKLHILKETTERVNVSHNLQKWPLRKIYALYLTPFLEFLKRSRSQTSTGHFHCVDYSLQVMVAIGDSAHHDRYTTVPIFVKTRTLMPTSDLYSTILIQVMGYQRHWQFACQLYQQLNFKRQKRHLVAVDWMSKSKRHRREVNKHRLESLDIPWNQKLNHTIWRGATTGSPAYVKTLKRLSFVRQYFNCSNTIINVGFSKLVQLDEYPDEIVNELKELMKESVSQVQLLQYKYLVSIEGNDVASNLNWLLMSNSV
eukprot:186045_1